MIRSHRAMVCGFAVLSGISIAGLYGGSD